jgi:hypothetical protein
MTPPSPTALIGSIGELKRKTFAYSNVLQQLKFMREEAVQTTLDPRYTESLGTLNRAAGNVEAFDTILKMLDIKDNTMQDTPTAGGSGSGASSEPTLGGNS